MNTLKMKEIEARILFLQNLIQKKEKELKKAPKGLINIACSGNRVQYYFKNESKDKARKYLNKTHKPLIKSLCQKDYDERVLHAAERELIPLMKLHKLYQKGVCENIYGNLIEARRGMVIPIELSDEEFVFEWQNREYPKKGFKENMPEYYTDNGERVRSKSEILIANTLKKYNIPYRYEAPLYLNGYGNIHPDFTVLNVRERKEYYWEHMGKMDDLEYIEQALQRINAYEKNDIFPGNKLILSHETLQYPINSRNIKKIIFQYLN